MDCPAVWPLVPVGCNTRLYSNCTGSVPPPMSDTVAQPAVIDGTVDSQLVISGGVGLQPPGVPQPFCTVINILDRPAVWWLQPIGCKRRLCAIAQAQCHHQVVRQTPWHSLQKVTGVLIANSLPAEALACSYPVCFSLAAQYQRNGLPCCCACRPQHITYCNCTGSVPPTTGMSDTRHSLQHVSGILIASSLPGEVLACCHLVYSSNLAKQSSYWTALVFDCRCL